ncbi:unnamed protein product [Nezara viridula]|uniref:Uncharacterized protein n=1 Tax=Nezara viridula TaxID=85310 RepID=A0A9P0E5L1_NEZVI|nr:unnamed protein product [Nezara viridula]
MTGILSITIQQKAPLVRHVSSVGATSSLSRGQLPLNENYLFCSCYNKNHSSEEFIGTTLKTKVLRSVNPNHDDKEGLYPRRE